jgi:hypothetical protein
MPDLATPPNVMTREQTSTARRVSIRACRPSLIDMRFKGDPWVVAGDNRAAVCLGDYSLGQVHICALDVPSLNRVLLQVRFGQARRNYLRRVRQPGEADA